MSEIESRKEAKLEVLKVWYSVFCTLVDAYREDEYNAPQFIDKMLALRDELTKAVPEVEAMMKASKQ
jgi:hypothetical protein